MSEDILVAIISGLFGMGLALLGGWFMWDHRRSEAKENEADAAAQISKAWKELLEPLERRIKTLEQQREVRIVLIEEQELKIQQMTKRILCLEEEQKRRDELIENQRLHILELETEIKALRDTVIQLGGIHED